MVTVTATKQEKGRHTSPKTELIGSEGSGMCDACSDKRSAEVPRVTEAVLVTTGAGESGSAGHSLETASQMPWYSRSHMPG